MHTSIVHVDGHIVVVDKPAGLLAVPGRGEDKQDCVALRVRAEFADALVVHRLDMATSGLMMFARGAAVQRLLSDAFAARAVHKRHVAVVDGHLPEDAGEIDLPLMADWPNRPLQKVDREHGKPSLTRWRVMQREADETHVLLEPVTGRSHQLRVHLSAIGHAILGDTLYASARVAQASARMLLHAQRLEFAHPATGRCAVFERAARFERS